MLTEELALASDLARRAGAIQRDRYERLERIIHKAEHDVVTEVDHLCEDLILAGIREVFPADALLAEESGASHAEGGSDPQPSGRTWIVDPLDGTVNYANGVPFFCVSIGLAVGRDPGIGVVYDPVRNELFSAVRGEGARLDGHSIALPHKERLGDCLVSLSLPSRGWAVRERAVRRRVRAARVMGSASLALAYLANGRFDAFIQLRGMSNWDVAAAGLIAAEAGATVTDAAGGPWFDMRRQTRTVGIIAAAGGHHATLKELLR